MSYHNLRIIQQALGEPGLPLAGPLEADSFATSENAVPESITTLLTRMSGGDREAFDHLVPLVYQELHRIAEGYLRRESRNHTLQPTALIHEAYVRLVKFSGVDFQNRTHFFGVAARVMRQI